MTTADKQDASEKPDRADLQQSASEEQPITTKSVTFTPAQLIAWADKQEAWGTSPAWSKNQDEADGYSKALRHLRYYVKNPVQDII